MNPCLNTHTQTTHTRIADNLPVATRLEFYASRVGGGGAGGLEVEPSKDAFKDDQFDQGYRLGFSDNGKVRTTQNEPTWYRPDRIWMAMTE